MLTAKRLVLGATFDDNNPLSILRGNALVLSKVFDDILVDAVRRCVRPSQHAYMIIMNKPGYDHTPLVHTADVQELIDKWSTSDLRSFYPLAPHSAIVTFPPSRGLNVNMMPFKLHAPVATLPTELHPYIDAIFKIPGMNKPVCKSLHSVHNRIAYITVQESDVLAGATQRRAGLHIESPLAQRCGEGFIAKPGGMRLPNDPYDAYQSIAWGMGRSENGWPIDGIYMASNVSDSCVVYPALVEYPEIITDAHGALPPCARSILGEGRRLKAGELCWITDRTPHEALPLDSHDPLVHRQFFRVVVGPVGVWYSKHNTANPLGIAPDAAIVHDDKFMIQDCCE